MTDEYARIAETLGEIKGGLAALNRTVHSYIETHDDRHELIDRAIKDHEAEINQAKGAKGAVIAMASGVSAVVGTAVALASKWLRP